ncbi:MAG: hypothetical protein K2M95_07930 [Clostridiales bacterium]|nr:hypothetical protein [Clostridiales bacterium]
MKKQRKEQDRVVVNSSPSFMVGYILMLCLLVGGAFLLGFSASFRADMAEEHILWLDIIVIPVGIISLVAFGTKLAFSRVELSKEGVKTSLFGGLCKKQFSWEEIKEIGSISRPDYFALFSKAETIDGMSYSKAAWSKDVIMVQQSRKLIEAVRRFAPHLLDDEPEQTEQSDLVENPTQANEDTMSARQYGIFMFFRYTVVVLFTVVSIFGVAAVVIGGTKKAFLWGLSMILFVFILSLIWCLIFERKYATKAYLHRLQKKRSKNADTRDNGQDRS